MEVCKTDVQTIIRLLDKSAELIDKYCKKPCEFDKARQAKKLSKKLKKKIYNGKAVSYTHLTLPTNSRV